MPTPPLDAFTARFLARMPPPTRGSFTRAQLLAITRAFGMRHARGHWLDLRRSVRLPWGRFYVVVLVGRDRED